MMSRANFSLLVLASSVLIIFIFIQYNSLSAKALSDEAKITNDNILAIEVNEKVEPLTDVENEVIKAGSLDYFEPVNFEFKDQTLPLYELKERLINGEADAAKAFVLKNRECYATRGYESADLFLANYDQHMDMEYESAKALFESCSGGVLDYEELKVLLYKGLSGSQKDLYQIAIIEFLPSNFNERHRLLIDAVRQNLDVDSYLLELFSLSAQNSRNHYFFANILINKNISIPPSYEMNIEQSILEYRISNESPDDLEQLNNLAKMIATRSDDVDQGMLDELFKDNF
ncbi:hypothetical protein J8M20_02770 [Pseudoalteromonas luteoviolacea]|uniref:hypothetical protein n=1 Tax=Pseudoalteromonas luteoviolacea TaxID=43657 RepID=UPI001B3697C0|nr:hypothetical protein [Pseudoalteromonas luteoviolacea]MBQ4810237.1 hypothetical protein [Pseudoalteromonas luteoviolacea]